MANESMLVSGTVSKTGIAELVLIPLLLRGFRPAPAAGKDLIRMERGLRKLCVGSAVRIIRDGQVLRLQ